MAEHNVVFTTLDAETPWSLDTYLDVDGYQAWKKILAEKTPQEDIIDMVKQSGLRGRGGAGFLQRQLELEGGAQIAARQVAQVEPLGGCAAGCDEGVAGVGAPGGAWAEALHPKLFAS